MSLTIVTKSGRTKPLPPEIDAFRVAGLDEEGRIVVDDFDARNAEPTVTAGFKLAPFMFGLTLCCNASDKGTESGVACRACLGEKPNHDTGHYLFRAEDGTFPGLDEIAHIA